MCPATSTFVVLTFSQYRGSRIQLLDTPGIIEGAAHGKGRGRQVIAVAKTAVCFTPIEEHTQGHSSRTHLILGFDSHDVRCFKRRPTKDIT